MNTILRKITGLFALALLTLTFATGAANPQAQKDETYIEVKEMDFKIPVEISMKEDLSYKIAGSSVLFRSKDLLRVSEFCDYGSAGRITKVKGTPSHPEREGFAEFYEARLDDIKQYDGFFLMFSTPERSCTSGQRIELEHQITDALRRGFDNIVL